MYKNIFVLLHIWLIYQYYFNIVFYFNMINIIAEYKI